MLYINRDYSKYYDINIVVLVIAQRYKNFRYFIAFMKYDFFSFLKIQLLKSLIFYDLDLNVSLVFFLLDMKV